jgi:hypothetical protein
MNKKKLFSLAGSRYMARGQAYMRPFKKWEKSA